MSAVISNCGLYRYRLERDVQMTGVVAALFGVNPSTADAVVNDATIRKDIGFAKVNGWRSFIKGNLFGYRATDVRELARVRDPVGPENDKHLWLMVSEADGLIPCWGSRDKIPERLRARIGPVIVRLLASGKPVMCFGRTKSGDPRHPLMLAYSTPLEPWETAEGPHT